MPTRNNAFFSGRSSEIDELLRRIVDEPITVLFGKSGLGKTSLLKAGVFRVSGERPAAHLSPAADQARRGTPTRAGAAGDLRQLRAQGVEHPKARDGETLWEYLHRPGQEFWTRQNPSSVQSLSSRNQFEEIFTLGRTIPTVIAAFREDLSDLVENRIPATIARRLDDGSLSDLGLDAHLMPYKVVLSLREDFLADPGRVAGDDAVAAAQPHAPAAHGIAGRHAGRLQRPDASSRRGAARPHHT